MKQIFEFLYYCFYSLVLKRDGDFSHERASFGYAISSSLYIISLYFFLKTYLQLKFIENKYVFFIIGIILFLTSVLLFSKYFRKRNRYIKILNRYKNDSDFLKLIYKLIAVIFFFLSFFIFAYSGFRMSEFLFSH